MRRTQANHAAVAATCHANPGQWQMVGHYGSGESADATVRAIRGAFQKGARSAYAPAGAFEARRELTDNGARVEARYIGEPVKDVETAVRELGALPVPGGSVRLTAEQRAKIAEQLGDAKPATPGLLVAFGESVRNRREHDHPQWEDLYCMNLSSYMGERIAPVLRRLLDAEAEAELLAAEELAYERLRVALESAKRGRRELRARVAALGLAEGLARAAEAEADGSEPTFFRPGRMYTRDLPFRASEDRPSFECVGVSLHPTKRSPRALGFEQPGVGQPWVSAAQRMEEWDAGWVDLGPVQPDRLTRTFAPTQTLQDEAPALTIYRAFWDTLPLGQYTREAEARKHCEAHARRDLPTASFDWIEDEEDGVAELVAAVGEDERPTGYVVDALEIASKYDPEADE